MNKKKLSWTGRPMRVAALTLIAGITGSLACADPAPLRLAQGEPLAPPGANVQRSSPRLRIGRGRFFSYAMPAGWHVGEDGQFALTLGSADNKALTVMVGNSGLPPQYSPAQFAYQKMMALQPERLQFGPPRQARPVAGFSTAYEFDVSYSIRGVPCLGVAKVSVAQAYDTVTMAMTAALSAADQWPGYSRWLPQVSDQISATDGAAFGMRGIMQQNLQNSTAFAQAARDYREWSQNNWQQVTDARQASQDRQNKAVRENLGAVQTFRDPYDDRSVELPSRHKYYWKNRQGVVQGTDDPSENPNVGSTDEWRQMQPQR